MYDSNMKRLAIWCVPLFLLVLAHADDLPDGKGKDVTVRICGGCHEAGVVDKYRYSKDDWQGVVEDMKGRGADGSDEDFQAIVAYLAHAFGPNVNINQASSKELRVQLEITAKEADAIVAYRMNQGPYQTLEDLKKVPGLDMQKILPLQQRITFK